MARGFYEGESRLTFTLKGLERGGDEHTLGSATYDLLDILDANKDVRDAELKFRDGRENIGSLAYSITALAALRALEKEPAACQSMWGQRLWRKLSQPGSAG